MFACAAGAFRRGQSMYPSLMRHLSFIVLLVVSVVAAVAGIWYFMRDEYPFQFRSADVAGATVESLSGAKVFGAIPAPPAELAGWISSSELDTSEVTLPATVRITIALRDGRWLQLDVGPEVTWGAWIGGVTSSAPVEIATNHDLYWYLEGVVAGLRSP